MNKKFLIYIFLINSALVFSSCYKSMASIDKLAVIVGIGHDSISDTLTPFSSTVETLTFKGNKEIHSKTIENVGSTAYNIVNNRQSKTSRKTLYATELSYIIGEKRAYTGIEDILNAILKNDLRNEKSYVAVTEGLAKDLLSIESKESVSMSEEIASLIKSMKFANFFSNDYEVIDMLKFYNSKGRQIIIPYIKIINNDPYIDGLAIFEDDKMKFHTDLTESKYINILRNSKCQGYLSYKVDNNTKYAEIKCLSRCSDHLSKDSNDKIIHNINIRITGEILINSTSYSITDLQSLFAESLKNDLENEINKIKKIYQLDCLDFGRKAYASFGDEKYFDLYYFLNSSVNLNVKVDIKSPGRTFN